MKAKLAAICLSLIVSTQAQLAFDVIGTVVDWSTSAIKELKQIGASKGFDVDWPKFLSDWRIQYGFAMQRVRRGDLPWMNSEGLRRMALDSLLSKFKITGLNEVEKDQIWRNRAH